MAAHNAECRGAGVSFVPIAVESLGGWSNEAALQISRIGRLVGQRLGTTPAEAVINPRRTCAARVTVLALCVCLSVCHRTSSYSVRFSLQPTASTAFS